MISEQTVLESPVLPAVTGTLRVPVARRHVTGIGAAINRFSGSVRQWISIPVLPYAALWEASLIAGHLGHRKTLEPDPVSTETPFLTDSWLRG
jgi:hypothetical protein